MSEDEFRRWLIYRRNWGISNLRGIEFGAALVAQSMRGGEFSDYLPQRGEKPVPSGGATIKQAMFALGGTIVNRG